MLETEVTIQYKTTKYGIAVGNFLIITPMTFQ